MAAHENDTSSAVKVIGFRVTGENGNDTNEGTSLPALHVANHTGSPLPVSIPPPFRTPRGADLANPPTPAPFRPRPDAATQSLLESDPGANNSQLTRQFVPSHGEKEVSSGAGGSKKDKGAAQKKEKTPGGNPQKAAVKGKGKKGGMEKRSAPPCVSFFDHLDQFKAFSREEVLRGAEVAGMDPVFVEFCTDYGEGRLHESAACKRMLWALSCAVRLFHNDEALFYTREVLAFLNHHIDFITRCRPLNIAMRNSIRSVKVEVTKLKSGIALEEGKALVKRVLSTFVEERVDVAQIIAKEAASLIKDRDVILTFASSETVLAVLAHAWNVNAKRFRVMVVEARPDPDAKAIVERLTRLGIPCTYLLINALSFALKDVTKVLLGASAVLSNGTVISRTGSAAVAMMAHAFNVPTIVCCQTLKFHERVQLDSFTHNELGNAKELLADGSPIRELEDGSHPFLNLLHLKYDLTPSEFVSIIVSELGFLPASSVSVILREQSNERDTPLDSTL